MPFRDAWLVIGALLVLLGFGTGEPVMAAVGFVVLIVGGVSRFWSKRLFDRTTLTRSLSQRRAFADEKIGLHVELANRKVIPLPWYTWSLALADHITVDGESLGGTVVPGLSWLARKGSMGWYERREWDFELSSPERGFHQVGPATLRSSDLFGVFPRVREDASQLHITIYPRVAPLSDLGLPADRPFGERKGGSRIFEDPLRIAGLREYRPGDPMRRIDWKATARSGDLTSRVYDPSATQQLYIALNIDTLEHAWEGYLKDELERAVSIAASVAVWAAGARYAVGLLANGAYPEADRPIRLAPSRSRDQLARVLEALAVIQPLTMGDLAGALLKESGRLPAGSTIVVVAALIPPPLAGVLTRLHSSGHAVYILATNQRAAEGAPAGIPVQVAGAKSEWSGGR